MIKRLIIMAIVGTEKDDDDDDDEALIYFKGSQNREWLKDKLKSEARDDIIGRDDIETLNVEDMNYEDIQALNNLNPNNAM